MLNVYTYFDDSKNLTPGFIAQIGIWKRSFRKHGWNPIVLTKFHAKKHPRYEEFVAKVSNPEFYPTVNPRYYEVACFVRWLALDVAGGGLMTDYDVVNRAFDAGDYAPVSSTLTFFDHKRCPCAVQASKAGCRMLFERFLDPERVKSSIINLVVPGWPQGHPHTSDMMVCETMTDIPVQKECWNVLEDTTAPLVHVSYDSAKILGKTKEALMRSLETK